jgi:YjbE family integral membrane protein
LKGSSSWQIICRATFRQHGENFTRAWRHDSSGFCETFTQSIVIHAAGKGFFLAGDVPQGGVMIDMGWIGQIAFTWEFLLAVMSIVLIDLVLAGDNAVVIAMAVKNLPAKRRRWGIILGAGGAVFVRVICTFLVAKLLTLQFIKLLGGAVIIWIAVKLLTEGAEEECQSRECGSIWQALWVIVVADMSMGIDNMLAVGAASHGNMFLLLFGLLLSIPFVVFMSSLLSMLMDRYPIILWAGAAILGKVGGEMMITDPWVHGLLSPPQWVVYSVMAFFIVFVCALSKMILNKRKSLLAIKPSAAIDGTS